MRAVETQGSKLEASTCRSALSNLVRESDATTVSKKIHSFDHTTHTGNFPSITARITDECIVASDVSLVDSAVLPCVKLIGRRVHRG